MEPKRRGRVPLGNSARDGRGYPCDGWVATAVSGRVVADCAEREALQSTQKPDVFAAPEGAMLSFAFVT